MSPNTVCSGKNKSCGNCTNIPATQMKVQKFGKLRMKFPEEVSPGSPKIVDWVCDCGKEVKSHIKSVVSGLRNSCSKCNEVTANDLAVAKFGKLRIKDPVDLTIATTKKVVWICDCGNETSPSVAHVLSGHTKSCGKCWQSLIDSFNQVKTEIRDFRTPIHPSDLNIFFLKPLENVEKSDEPFRAECFMCGSEYYPRWGDIRLGKSLTCGCSTNRVSTSQKEINNHLQSLGTRSELEFRLGPFIYDIVIPEKQILVEFNGLFWHSREGSKDRDVKKRNFGIQSGYRVISIFEDEWTFRREAMEGILQNLVGGKPTPIRGSKVRVERIDAKMADPFLERFHYIGKSKSAVNYGAFHQNELVCVASFSKPRRQSSHEWELTRMASDPKFRVHGIWSKILKMFTQEFSPNSIVSFSDNRLFSGSVYSRIGFTRDGDVSPDYYWFKNKRRHNKSGLRKPEGTLQTETELRESQGYRKIWDFGKTRWVMRP